MEKRNVATSRRAVDLSDDIEEAAAMFGDGLPKKASVSSDDLCAMDEKFDEDTGTGDRSVPGAGSK